MMGYSYTEFMSGNFYDREDGKPSISTEPERAGVSATHSGAGDAMAGDTAQLEHRTTACTPEPHPEPQHEIPQAPPVVGYPQPKIEQDLDRDDGDMSGIPHATAEHMITSPQQQQQQPQSPIRLRSRSRTSSVAIPPPPPSHLPPSPPDEDDKDVIHSTIRVQSPMVETRSVRRRSISSTRSTTTSSTNPSKPTKATKPTAATAGKTRAPHPSQPLRFVHTSAPTPHNPTGPPAEKHQRTLFNFFRPTSLPGTGIEIAPAPAPALATATATPASTPSLTDDARRPLRGRELAAARRREDDTNRRKSARTATAVRKVNYCESSDEEGVGV